MKYIIFLLLIFSFFSCSNDNVGFKITDEDYIQIEPESLIELSKNDLHLTEYTESLEYLELKDTPDNGKSINKILANQSVIVCQAGTSATDQVIYIYDINGQFKTEVKLPELNILITDFQLTNRRIVVLAGINSLLVEFDFAGMVTKETKLPLTNICNISYQEESNQFLLHTPYKELLSDNGVLNLFEGEDLTDHWGEPEIKSNKIFSTTSRFYSSIDGTSYLRELNSGAVYSYDSNSAFKKIVNFNISDIGPEVQTNIDNIENDAIDFLYSQPFYSMYATNNQVAFNSISSKGLFTYFYNTVDDSVIKIRHTIGLEPNREKFDFFFPGIIGNSGDKFISMMTAEKFKTRLDLLYDVNENAEELTKHLPSTNELDGPLLIFYKI